MKVNDVSKSNELSSGKVKKSSSGADFASFLRDVSQEKTAPISNITNVSNLDAIFATQMVSNEEEQQRRKKLINRGYSLLEKLEEIRKALLSGYMSMDSLIEISRLVKEHKTECDDARLMDILQEIELRVEVELAKLTK